MKKTILSIVALAITVLFLSGCLTVEKKEYTFVFTGENSGTLTIKYVNIMSIMDDTLDVSAEDFEELLSSYIEGSLIEESFPNATVLEKELFEENRTLCARIVLEFDNIEDVKLYRYNKQGPFMYCINCSLDTEIIEWSNGIYGGDIMPVVFWEKDLDKLNMITSITNPDETTVGLLRQYYLWKKQQ